MSEPASIPRRLARIKRLAREYFEMDKGLFIERHEELLRIADIRGPKCTDHPHRLCRVYISRRSLKHFVEERKEALLRKHSEDEALEAICFAIDHVPETLMDYDRHEHEPKQSPPKHFYSKDYSDVGRPWVRVLFQQKDKTLEIRSIHFETRGDRREIKNHLN